MRYDKPRQPSRRSGPDPSQPTAVYPLPRDTTSVLRAHGGKCQNLGLWLDRFILYEQRGSRWEQSRPAKKREAAPLNLQALSPLLAACRERWDALLRSYEPGVARFTVAPEWRIVVGLGAEHALETNLTLHRIYGIPFIPASALKGLTRAYAFWQIADQLGVPPASLEEMEAREQAAQKLKSSAERAKLKTPLEKLDQLLSAGQQRNQDDPQADRKEWLALLRTDALCRESEALQSLNLERWCELADDFYRIFGTTENKGEVVFFDAYPTQAPRLKLDIMNPHYAPYYSDNAKPKRTPPANYHSPLPVYFLTIERTPFAFALAASDLHLRETAEGWLKGALSELGVGAKTAAGYGFFLPPQR